MPNSFSFLLFAAKSSDSCLTGLDWLMIALYFGVLMGVGMGVNDPRIMGRGGVSVQRALAKLLHQYGPWLTTLQASDPVAIPVDELPDVQVVATMVGGRWVHGAPPWE
jgi:hypothetical protein